MRSKRYCYWKKDELINAVKNANDSIDISLLEKVTAKSLREELLFCSDFDWNAMTPINLYDIDEDKVLDLTNEKLKMMIKPKSKN